MKFALIIICIFLCGCAKNEDRSERIRIDKLERKLFLECMQLASATYTTSNIVKQCHDHASATSYLSLPETYND